MEIVSKRHFYRFYLFGIIFLLFMIGIGSIPLSAGIRNGNDLGVVFFLFFVAIGLHTNYMSIKYSPKIVLNQKGILYKNQFHSWDEIQDIQLTGKSRLFLGAISECTTITLSNLQTIKIFDKFYANSPQMKYFIQEVIINKKEHFDFNEQKINTSDVDRESFIPFKGNPIFSFRSVLMWGLIAFIVGFTAVGGRKLPVQAYFFMTVLCSFWFILHASMMDYFEISKNYFVVKNHYFFWKKKVYPISGIKEIVYEQYGRLPNSLRIITTKFHSKLFHAGTLTTKTWLEMQDALLKKNITVRNECI